ncbi:hypothetical protein RIF29_41291 [Crotalaria pallida]|uniref:Uncharacterized protein n=1 Tax=Crotalaria pallida TaxID=3830 RepID=A0AAN9HV46_CROPI
MIWEARLWKEDPVNGAFARYKQLLATYEEVMAENSILKSQAATAESFGFDWDDLLGEPSMDQGQQLHFSDEQQQPLGAMEEFQFHSDQQQQQQQPPLVTVVDSGSQFTNDHFSNNSNHQGVLNSVMDQTLDDFLDNVTINVDNNYYDPSAATIAQNLNPTGPAFGERRG